VHWATEHRPNSVLKPAKAAWPSQSPLRKLNCTENQGQMGFKTWLSTHCVMVPQLLWIHDFVKQLLVVSHGVGLYLEKYNQQF
jgi:hypothetical protein